jgi:hypothetical protein
LKCLVCLMPQPGPHKMSCRPSEREAAARSHGRTSDARAAWLHAGSTPWGDAPTRYAMLAQLEAFCARYAEALERDVEWLSAVCTHAQIQSLRAKAAMVREPFP